MSFCCIQVEEEQSSSNDSRSSRGWTNVVEIRHVDTGARSADLHNCITCISTVDLIIMNACFVLFRGCQMREMLRLTATDTKG